MMPNLFMRVSVGTVYLLLPLTVWTANRLTTSGRPFTAWFVDVGKAAGLVDPQICGNEQTKRDIHEIPGTGVAFLDFDNDGLLDILLVNGSRLDMPHGAPQPINHLYRNVGHRQFTDVTQDRWELYNVANVSV